MMPAFPGNHQFIITVIIIIIIISIIMLVGS